jgi:hypothetical protein
VIAIAVLFASMTVQASPAKVSAEQEVRQALDDYLQGQATGDKEHYQRTFHPQAMLHGVRDGRTEQRSLSEYVSMQSGRPAPDEAQRRRSITDVRVSGDAAMATIILNYPRAVTTDYMSMVRENGRWLIVHKLYNVQSRRSSVDDRPSR